MNAATTRRRDEAAELLKEILARGPVPVSDVMAYAQAAGLGWETVRKARVRLGIKSAKHGGRFGGDPRWFWEMPAAEEARSSGEASIRPESSVSAEEALPSTRRGRGQVLEGGESSACPEARPPLKASGAAESREEIKAAPEGSSANSQPDVRPNMTAEELEPLYGADAGKAAKLLASRSDELYLRGMTRFHLQKRGLPSGKEDVVAVVALLRGEAEKTR